MQKSCGRKEHGTARNYKKLMCMQSRITDSVISQEVAEVGKPHLCTSYRMLNAFVYI